MNTTAVYVVVSNDDDIYFEQAWMSIWSLKHYNPKMKVVCVVDQDTYTNIVNCHRKNAIELINEIITVEFPDDINKKVRSRLLKTNLREYVQDDFLFIDTDTIICGCLKDVDSLPNDLMMVKDSHCNLSEIPSSGIIRKSIERISGEKYASEEYFNSGVIYCKDTELSRDFYEKWHETYKYGLSKGVDTDQRSLALVQQSGRYITELNGIYNCQVRLSINYLSTARILHFFTGIYYTDYLNPFFGKALYKELKNSGRINDELKDKILNCRTLFMSPSYTIAKDELLIFKSKAFRLLLSSYRQIPYYYRFLERISAIQVSILSFLKHSLKR